MITLRARPDVPLRLAFLDFMQPDLETAAEALVAAGCEALRIVPVFFGQGGHLREDVPRVVAAVRARHPGVAVEVLDAIGENDAVLGAIAAARVPWQAVGHETMAAPATPPRS